MTDAGVEEFAGAGDRDWAPVGLFAAGRSGFGA